VGSVEGSAVEEGPLSRGAASLSGYGRLDGPVPVLYAPGSEESAAGVWDLLMAGTDSLSEILDVDPPDLEALLVSDEDWEEAPRENDSPYPPGLPYFTRAASPPALVLPETLSPVFRPRTGATYPLVVWHELAHAFLLRDPVARTPAWLRELLPQALSAAVARRTGLPLDQHLEETPPGLTVRGYSGSSDADRQMAFQNLLLALGAAAVEEFGEVPLRTLAHALREEEDVVDDERAEELLTASLGPGGREWLRSHPEF
jgi:hypothetical protein